MMFRIFCLLVTVFATKLAQAAPPVTALAYRADGQILAAGSRGVVTLIDTATGDVVGTLPGQTTQVTALAFSPANWLAVASGEASKSGIIQLYDLSATPLPKKPTAIIPAHKDLIYTIAFSPDGKTLASGSYDRVIKLWAIPSPANNSPLQTLTDHSDAVYSLAFHPNGKLLASGAADRAVKIWDVATGQRLYTLSDSTDWVYAVAWSPNGSQLAAGGVDRSLRVWDANTEGGKLVSSVFAHEKPVTRILFGPKGESVFTIGEDRIIKSWNAKTLTESLVFPAQPEAVLSAALHPDGRQLAIGRFDGVVQLLDAKTAKLTASPLPVKPKPATLTSATPDSVVRGQKTRMMLHGTNFKSGSTIKCATPGVSVQVVEATSANPSQFSVDVTTTSSAVPGPVSFTVVSDAGESNALRLWLDRFPMVREVGLTDSARDGMMVTLPATVAGVLDRNGDVDFFRFQATAGQQIGVQIHTTLDRTKFDPVVTMTDTNGVVLATGNGGLLGYTCGTPGMYAISVHDREFRGGADYGYRLHVGPIPVMTGIFPLGVTRGQETSVQVTGVNLGAMATAPILVKPAVDAVIGSKMSLNISRTGTDPIGGSEVTIGEFPATRMPVNGTATVTSIPATVDGILTQANHFHTVRFTAKKGQRLIIETDASRLGSPVDPFLVILDTQGNPVPRAVLRCTAKTYTTFRDNDSVASGIRLETWNELAIDDFLFVGGELMRIKDLPKGPDDDCQFYAIDGKRVGYADTTPTHHANGSTVYKVEQHPPGTTFLSNGMPLFPLVYQNDDGGPGYGKDSRIVFDPPTDGEYQVRIRDASGASGPTHAYRLTVRTPKPDYTISVSPSNPKVWKNGAIPLSVTAKRLDGFDGPIAIHFDGLPTPLTAPATTIEAGQLTATVSLAAGDATIAKDVSKWKVTAQAQIDGKDVTRDAMGGTITIGNDAELGTTTNISELVIRPGHESRMLVKIDRRNDFKGRVPIEVRGLPHGVRVQNIGLSGILITPDRTEREVVIYAEPWVKPVEVPFVVLSKSERKNTEHAAPSVLLKVLK